MRRLLMVERDKGSRVEAEPVVVNTDQADVVVLELDDGEELRVDRRELAAALEDEAA